MHAYLGSIDFRLCRRVAEMRKHDDFEETDTTTGQTAKEDEDTWEAELAAFTPANTVTGKNMKLLSREQEEMKATFFCVH